MTRNLGLDEKTRDQIEPRVPSTAAQRALAEAEARRAQKQEAARATEIGGRDGPDPIRYGDWEVKGIASDF
jgi:hypothetical protein